MSNEVKEKENEAGLMDFSWDNSEDFFGMSNEPKEEPAVKSSVKEVGGEDDSSITNLDSKKQSEPEKEVDNFFDEDDENNESSEKQSLSYSTLYKNLKQKGVISIEVEDENDIDEETFIEIQEEEIEARMDETIKSFMDELDDDAKAFLRFKREGGETSDFFKIYNELGKIPTPASDEKSQIKFLEYYYSNFEDLDEDDIEDKIEWLKETGKVSKYAEKYYDNIEEQIKVRQEETVRRQQEMQKQQEEQRKQYVKDLKNLIEDNGQIKDWSLTSKDKKDLHGYMTKAAVKIGENNFLTQFQNDLQQAFKDKEKTVLLAKLLSNDFDLSDLKEKAKTELVRETKSKLSNSKITPVSNKGSRNKGLIDYF